MENVIYYSALYDYYSNLLTEKQCKYFEEYNFNNLSLSEIAENYTVSKNAVSKTLIEVNHKLDYFEKQLHLYQNKVKIKGILDSDSLKAIEEYI